MGGWVEGGGREGEKNRTRVVVAPLHRGATEVAAATTAAITANTTGEDADSDKQAPRNESVAETLDGHHHHHRHRQQRRRRRLTITDNDSVRL